MNGSCAPKWVQRLQPSTATVPAINELRINVCQRKDGIFIGNEARKERAFARKGGRAFGKSRLTHVRDHNYCRYRSTVWFGTWVMAGLKNRSRRHDRSS